MFFFKIAFRFTLRFCLFSNCMHCIDTVYMVYDFMLPAIKLDVKKLCKTYAIFLFLFLKYPF